MKTDGGGSADTRQDVLLYRFYRQVTRRHEARLGTGDDIAAGAHRSGGWLYEHTVRPGEILQGPRGKHASIPGLRADRGADRTVAALYGQHYAALVRLASLLVGDAVTGEEIVQDSFVALYASRRRLGDGDWALSYLRQSVLHRSRSAGRGHTGTEPKAPGPGTEGPAGPGRRSTAPGGSAVISALRALPARQREAVVMRYYAGLSEERVAEAMAITRRAAREHTERGMVALRAMLDAARTPAG
jgi:DNA-directed RNA polymerase specialized sigma24 family protein